MTFDRLRGRRLAGGGSIIALVLGFLVLYVLLDRVSFIHAFGPLRITPWNPPAGLSLALLLLAGLRYLPLLYCAVLLADLLVRGVVAIAPASILSALVITLGYGGAVLVMRWSGFDPTLRRLSDMFRLLLVALAAAALVAVGYVGCFILGGVVRPDDFATAALRFWVGDAIGIAVLTPALLLYWPRRRWLVTRWPRPGLEILLQAASIPLVLWLIFGLDVTDEFKFFYLLFLPLTWIAVRQGLLGVSLGLVMTQVGLLIASQNAGHATAALIAFQLLMLALATTSLFLGAAIDERARAAAALRQSESRLQAILNTAPDAIVTVGADGVIVSGNPAAARMFGRPAADLAGRPVATLLSGLQVPLAAGGSEILGRRADGSMFPIEATISGEAGDDGHVCVLRDVSDRKQAEARLREHQAELAHVGRLSLVGEMASALAHELNQPLAAIVNYLRGCRRLLAQPASDPSRLVAAIGEATGQAERAGAIIRHMRDFTRKGIPAQAAEDLEPLLEDAMQLTAADAERRGVVMRRVCEAGLPKVMVDRIQIEQVILNLLRNSLEAIEGAGIRHGEIELLAGRRDANSIEITVRDNGPGIAEEMTERLFQPFATTKSSGTGLGLSLSRSIVEAHGGTLIAMPGNGAGASFCLTLPVANAGVEDDD